MTFKQLLDAVFATPDAQGECDGCHADVSALVLDDDGCGDFMYCRCCWAATPARRQRLAEMCDVQVSS